MGRRFVLEADCVIRPEKRREFELSSASLRRKPDRAHRRTVVYQDQEEPDHYLWVEEWDDRESLDRYLQSESFLVLLGALRTLGSVSTCRLIEYGGMAAEAGSVIRPDEGRQLREF